MEGDLPSDNSAKKLPGWTLCLMFFTVQGVISSVTFGISALLMSFIADVYGIRFSFYLSVCCFLISGWISYRQRKIWSFDTGLTQKSGNASI